MSQAKWELIPKDLRDSLIDFFLEHVAKVCQTHAIAPGQLLAGNRFRPKGIPAARAELAYRLRDQTAIRWVDGKLDVVTCEHGWPDSKLPDGYSQPPYLQLAALFGLDHSAIVKAVKSERERRARGHYDR